MAERKRQRMTEDDLVSIVKSLRSNSLGAEDSEISNERAAAMDHYHGRPYGDEVEGQSAVVSKDLAETVDWVMPALMRVFTQSGSVVEFPARDEGDVDQARQETEYVNYVFMEENEGFVVLHDMIKDALLLKNGYVKYWWDVEERVKEEEYSGLADDELLETLQPYDDEEEVEVLEHDTRYVYLDPETGQAEEVEPPEEEELGPNMVELYDVRIKRTCKKGLLRVEAVPAEEVMVHRAARGSTQKAKFTAHLTTKTRSELIEMGLDEDWVYDLPSSSEDDDQDQTETSRDSVSDESDDLETQTLDRSTEEVEYLESYPLVDWDGDGVAERRRVILIGGKLPEDDDYNQQVEFVNISSISPKRVPHRHVGESLDDDLQDLQKIKTVLFRQLLNNAYFTNHPEYLVNERVNLPDFYQHVPGQPKRVRGEDPVDGSARALQPPQIIQNILPVIDHVDTVMRYRTGINEASTGMNPDMLQETTKGAFLENMKKAGQKVEMIARLMAETGIKEMMLNVHALLIKHQDKPKKVKLFGKDYVDVDPTSWRGRENMRVRVGLGTGSEEERMQRFTVMRQLLMDLTPFRMVAPQHAYALFEDLGKELGFADPSRYAFDPESEEYQRWVQQITEQQQGSGDPKAQAYMMVEQEKSRIRQLELGMKQQQQQFERMLEVSEQRHKQMMDRLELAFRQHEQAEDTATARTKLELDSERDVPGSEV